MVLVPLVLFTRPAVLGAMGEYGKQNVPYGPAIADILASNKDRPSIVLATDHQLAGNFRLHAADIPVTIPGYERLEQPYAFDATHPVLVVWRRSSGKAVPVPACRTAGTGSNAKAHWPAKELDVRDVAAALPLWAGGRPLSFQLCLDLPGSRIVGQARSRFPNISGNTKEHRQRTGKLRCVDDLEKRHGNQENQPIEHRHQKEARPEADRLAFPVQRRLGEEARYLAR